MRVVEQVGGEQRAAEQRDAAHGEQAGPDLADAVAVAVDGRRQLLAGWSRGQQVQKEEFGAAVVGEGLEAGLACRRVAVDDVESQLGRVDAGLADGAGGRRVGDDEDRQGVGAAQQALADEVLVQLRGFAGKTGRDAGDAAVGERHQAGENRLPVEDQALAHRVILAGEQQRAPRRPTEPGQQATAELGDGVQAGQRHLGIAQCFQPRLDDGRAGQRGEQQPLVLALALLVAERDGRGVWRAEEVLAELAGDQRGAVAALQEGDDLDLVAFLGEVGEQLVLAAGVQAQVLGETRQVVGAVLEGALGLQPTLPPGVSREALRIEVEQAARGQILILAMTS